MFKSFCDVPFEQLPENEDFRAHGLQVTEAISLAVSTLDDLETLELILKDLGAAHVNYGLDDSYFDVSNCRLLQFLAVSNCNCTRLLQFCDLMYFFFFLGCRRCTDCNSEGRAW